MSKKRSDAAGGIERRGGLGGRVEQLFPDPALFERVGGRSVVSRLIDELYDRLEADAELAPKFVRDTALERNKQKQFFEEWLGGEPLYSQHVAWRGLCDVHAHIHIAPGDAARWLAHFESAMVAAGIDAGERKEIRATLAPLARALVNESRAATKHEHRCHREKTGKLAAKAAGKGDVDAVFKALDTDELLEEWGSRALVAAAGRGKLDVIRALIEAGVDSNRAAPSDDYDAHHTPLFAARARAKRAAVELLKELGARNDVFTEAALGSTERVEALIGDESAAWNDVDPAQDFFRLGALHHAILADQVETALALLARGAEPGPLGSLLVRQAAGAENIELVTALLDAGACAKHVGPGRWVLNRELSKLLRAHGADVNYAPDPHSSWIWDACTGNHSQKGDPDYVRALIEHGADVSAMYGWGKAALHFASKAGFVEVVRVLLDAGADPNQRDERDSRTPLFHAFMAGKSVDPTIVASVLLERGADPNAQDKVGKTVAQRYPAAAAFLARR